MPSRKVLRHFLHANVFMFILLISNHTFFFSFNLKRLAQFLLFEQLSRPNKSQTELETVWLIVGLQRVTLSFLQRNFNSCFISLIQRGVANHFFHLTQIIQRKSYTKLFQRPKKLKTINQIFLRKTISKFCFVINLSAIFNKIRSHYFVFQNETLIQQ